MEIAQDVVRVLRRYLGRGRHGLCLSCRRDHEQGNQTKARRTPNAEIHTVVSRAPHSTNGSYVALASGCGFPSLLVFELVLAHDGAGDGAVTDDLVPVAGAHFERVEPAIERFQHRLNLDFHAY